MRNYIYGILFSISFILTSSSVTHQQIALTLDQTHIEAVQCKYSQCKAKAKSTGRRCKHCVSNSGDDYCWQHD